LGGFVLVLDYDGGSLAGPTDASSSYGGRLLDGRHGLGCSGFDWGRAPHDDCTAHGSYAVGCGLENKEDPAGCGQHLRTMSVMVRTDVDAIIVRFGL